MRPRGRSTRRSSIADRTVTAATNTHAATLGVGTAETATASTTAATATATAEEEEEEEEAPAAVAAAARRRSGRAGRRRRAEAGCRRLACASETCVSEAGSYGRESSRSVPHPQGIIGKRAQEVMTTSRGCSGATKPASGLPSGCAHWRSQPCLDLGLKPIARRPHPARSKVSSTYGRMVTVRTQTFGSKWPQKSASVASVGAQQRTHHG